MGFVVVLLLAGILCTMLFGPWPVLVVLGLAAAYAVLWLIVMGIVAIVGIDPHGDRKADPRYLADPLGDRPARPATRSGRR